MTASKQRLELGEFLRSRREALVPQAFGIERRRRSRTTGLRREEVADRAEISVTWYTWLEQGRDISVAHDTLGRIGRALKFSPSDMAYLFSLAGAAPPHVETVRYEVDTAQQVALDCMNAPALMLDARLDVIAFNKLADRVLDITAGEGPMGRNNAWRLFMDPERRRLYSECWERVAQRTVGVLRAARAHRLEDSGFEALIATMRGASADFERMWKQCRTSTLDPVTTPLRHRELGSLLVVLVRFMVPGDAGTFVSVLTPANARTIRAFRSGSTA